MLESKVYLLGKKLKLDKKCHDDDDFSPLQPKAFFTSELVLLRVLSILANP